jgi:hypothetical protein
MFFGLKVGRYASDGNLGPDGRTVFLNLEPLGGVNGNDNRHEFAENYTQNE